MTTRERSHECFLRIDIFRITEISWCGRSLHFMTTIKFPGVVARIFLVFERRVAALPSERNFVFRHAFSIECSRELASGALPKFALHKDPENRSPACHGRRASRLSLPIFDSRDSF